MSYDNQFTSTRYTMREFTIAKIFYIYLECARQIRREGALRNYCLAKEKKGKIGRAIVNKPQIF